MIPPEFFHDHPVIDEREDGYYLYWHELTEDMGAGNHIRAKEEKFDLCEDCRKSLLTCMDKGPIWEYVARIDREFTELKCENNSLKAAIDATGYTCLGVSSAPCEKKGWFGWR